MVKRTFARGIMGITQDIRRMFDKYGDPDALWKDIQKLDDMYEELLWHPDDELQFTHDGVRIIITNKTLEDKQQ